jgi:hypothetical protein
LFRALVIRNDSETCMQYTDCLSAAVQVTKACQGDMRDTAHTLAHGCSIKEPSNPESRSIVAELYSGATGL